MDIRTKYLNYSTRENIHIYILINKDKNNFTDHEFEELVIIFMGNIRITAPEPIYLAFKNCYTLVKYHGRMCATLDHKRAQHPNRNQFFV